MICSECWASAAQGAQKCPRCGAKLTGAPPSLRGLLKAYPWVVVLLTLSVLVTLWAATRRASAPEPIPDAVEPPAAEIPEPTPVPEPQAPPMPIPEAVPEPAPEPAPPAVPTRGADSGAPSIGPQRSDGTWEAGPGAPKPGNP